MDVLPDSDLFYIMIFRKGSFGFRTFGLDWKWHWRTVHKLPIFLRFFPFPTFSKLIGWSKILALYGHHMVIFSNCSRFRKSCDNVWKWIILHWKLFFCVWFTVSTQIKDAASIQKYFFSLPQWYVFAKFCLYLLYAIVQ